MDAPGGMAPDVDSAIGAKEVRRRARHRSFLEGKHVLKLAGMTAETIVDNVCVRHSAPAGFAELSALRIGLGALQAAWSAKRSRADGRQSVIAWR